MDSTTTRTAEERIARVRFRLLIGFGVLFLITMTVAGPLSWLRGQNSDGDLLHIIELAILALGLPLLMAELARRVLEPAAELTRAQAGAVAGPGGASAYDQARIGALIDPITGLGNHTAFQEQLHHELELAHGHEQPVAVVLLDLDDLERINDDRGHAAGDQLLITMGRLITTACRAGDRGFRIGGDEFAILLPRCDAEQAHGVARRILGRALGNDPVGPPGERFSFSAGVSAHPHLAADAHELIRQADAAREWAKRHGRTDVQVFDPGRHTTKDDIRSARELSDAVARVAQRRDLTPVFQPIVELATGLPVGFEGLARPAADSGFRDADSLFAAAEAANRSVELDLACMDVIAAGAAAWADAAHYVSINVSPRSLETDQFSVVELTALLGRHGLRPEQVMLELTERHPIEDMERLRINIAACRASGMRIAADDVGAGDAALRLLSQIRFDVVKVDLSLIGTVVRDSAIAVLRALCDLARQSGAEVIAEGIERTEQLEIVRELGITHGQGYLIARPATEVRLEPIDVGAAAAATQDVRLAFLDIGLEKPLDATFD